MNNMNSFLLLIGVWLMYSPLQAQIPPILGPYPVLTNAQPIGGDTVQVCMGDSATFQSSALSLSTLNIDSFYWDFNGALATNPGNVSSITTNAWVAPGIYPIVHVVRRSVPIISPTLSLSNPDTLWLVVSALPSVSPAPDTAVCRGNGIALKPILGVNTDSIFWFPNPTLSYGRQDSVWVMPSTPTTYAYKAYTKATYNGTTWGFCKQDWTTTVNVWLPPRVRTLNDTIVCEGDSLLLDVQPPLPPLPVSPVSFEWAMDVNFNTIIATTRRHQVYNLAGPTKFYVRITDGNGCTTIDSLQVLVRQRPAPPIASVLDNNVCLGERIALRASDTSVVNSWRGPNGFGAPLGFFDIPAISTAQTGYYTITSRNSFGCPSHPDSVYVTVNAPPTVPSITGDDAFCEGVPLQLWASPNAGTSLYWRAPNGDSLGSNNLLIPSDSSHYLSGTWTLVVEDAAGCKNSRDTLITIYPAPIWSTTLPPINVCQGQNITLNVPTLPNVTTYNWLDSAGVWVAQGQGAIINNITSSRTLFLQVTTLQGCTFTLDSIEVFVFPTAAAPPIYVDTVACVGERNIVFRTNPAQGYFWRRNGRPLSFQDSLVIDTARLADAGLYVLSVLDNNGCLSDSATVNFTVNTRPNIPVVDTVTPVCEGDTVFLKGTAVAGLVAEWRDSFGTHLAGYSVFLAPDSIYYRNGFWRLIVVDSTTTCRRRAEDVFVEILPAPKITVSNSGPVCLGQSAVLTAADSTNSGVPLSFVWYRDAALTDTVSTNATVLINNLQADSTFYVVATNGAGCSSVVKSTTIQLSSIPAPPVVPDTLVACEGSNVQLTTSSLGLSYQWSGPNNYSSILRNPTISSIQPNQAGNYSLIISYLSSCPSRPAVTTVVVEPTPAPPIAIVPFYLCANDTLYLTADSSSHCSQLNWIGPNTANFPLTGNNVAIPPGDTNHVGGFWRVECVDSASNCISRSSANFLLLYPTPATPVVASVTPVCVGDSVSLRITSNINSGDIINWYRDSTLGNVLDTGPSIQVGPVTSNQVYYVVVTNFGGCSSVPVPVPVSVIPPSAPPMIVGDSVYCVNDSIVWSSSIGSSDYDWSSTTGWTSTDSSTLVTGQANASHIGTYFLRVKDSNGCWTPTTSWAITINNNPAPPVAYSNSPICEGEPMALLTNASCGQWQWYGPLGASGDTILWGDASYLPNSQWYVECIDTATGCSSLSNTITISINEAPIIDSITVLLPTCVGDSLLATATASIPTNIPLQYSWYNTTTLIGSGASLSLGAVSQSFMLYLLVIDTTTGCEQVDSVPIVINPIPNPPLITGNLNYCQGDSLLLTTTTLASQYYWTGPNGWVSTNNSSTRILSVLDSGTYYLSVADANGCFSPTSNVGVSVTPLPDSFVVYSGGGVCAGQDGNLFIAGDSTLVYDWYQLPNNTYVGTGTNLVLPNVQASDSAYYYAIARGNGCSLQGDSVLLPVYTPAVVAEAGLTQILCNRDTTTLIAQPITSSVSGVWTSSSAVAIQSPHTTTTSVGPLPVGSHVFYWTLSNATCVNFAVDSVVIEVLPIPSEQANAGADQYYCGISSINLAALAPQIGTGYWTQSSSQSNTGVVIVDSLSPTSALLGLQEGQQYSFVWQLKNGNCGIYSTDTLQLIIDSLPTTTAFAGLDQTVCWGDSIVLQAQAAPAGQTGTWLSFSGGLVVAPNQPNSLVSNLTIGSHQLVWALSTSNCPNYSTDTVTMTVINPQPIAQADSYLLSSSNTVIDVTPNDLLPNNWIITIQQPMNQGQLTNLNTGEFAVTLPSATGEQSFIYQICDAVCVNSCDTAMVVLSIEQLLECPIPNIFTPNNDGVNDLFEIPCVSEQQTVYFAVYNRWGDEVYKSDNYLNQWDGKHAGAALPDGTYFYMLQWPNGVNIQGSVEIRR